jgi:hypothetical protein
MSFPLTSIYFTDLEGTSLALAIVRQLSMGYAMLITPA